MCVMDHQITSVSNSALANIMMIIIATYEHVSMGQGPAKCIQCFNPHNRFMEITSYICSANKDIEAAEFRKWWRGICSVPPIVL